MINWTKEWPTCSGYYWFYGWCFRDRHRKPELHFVKSRQLTKGTALVTNGHFLYKAEGGDGYWLPVVRPILPNELYNSLVERMEDPWNSET